MYFKNYNLKRTATKFDNKEDAYSYWQSNGGYLLKVSVMDDELYVVEDNNENSAYEYLKEEFPEVIIGQIETYFNQRLQFVDYLMTEGEYWNEEELSEGLI